MKKNELQVGSWYKTEFTKSNNLNRCVIFVLESTDKQHTVMGITWLGEDMGVETFSNDFEMSDIKHVKISAKKAAELIIKYKK